MLVPNQVAPKLIVPTLSHGIFDLTKEKSRNFTMVVFFRGLHCPICINYLSELARLQSEFFDNGVNQIVISSDDKTRSEETASLIKADQIRYGYDLSIPVAREWGLYISKGVKNSSNKFEEPELFPEPGIFLIRPDNTVYYISVQSMPFARSAFTDLIEMIKFVVPKEYPARGTA